VQRAETLAGALNKCHGVVYPPSKKKFVILSSCENTGWGRGHIPPMALRGYATVYHLLLHIIPFIIRFVRLTRSRLVLLTDVFIAEPTLRSWNNLPLTSRSAYSIRIFHSRLKTHLYRQYSFQVSMNRSPYVICAFLSQPI
jgi:hypothetical protein